MTQEELTPQNLRTYSTGIVRPRLDRNDLNKILGSIIESAATVLDGGMIGRTRLFADLWTASLLLHRQTDRIGLASWARQDRELTRVLYQCVKVLREAVGEDASKLPTVAKLQAIFSSAYPTVSALVQKRLALDITHQVDTESLALADVQLRVAAMEARRAAGDGK